MRYVNLISPHVTACDKHVSKLELNVSLFVPPCIALLHCICCIEQTSAGDTSSTVGVASVLNRSSEDLWTDTDDDSFVRATQSVLDTAADCFTSPMAVARSTAVTSTPNVKTSRCRRTFCLDPASPCPASIRPRCPGTVPAACSSLPVAVSSPVTDVSFTDELLATLAEPDDVLDSQIKLTDAAAVAVEKQSSVSHTATERRDVCAGNTTTGMHVSSDRISVTKKHS